MVFIAAFSFNIIFLNYSFHISLQLNPFSKRSRSASTLSSVERITILGDILAKGASMLTSIPGAMEQVAKLPPGSILEQELDMRTSSSRETQALRPRGLPRFRNSPLPRLVRLSWSRFYNGRVKGAICATPESCLPSAHS